MRRVVELHRELLGDENPDTLQVKTWLAFIELSQDAKDDYGDASMVKLSHSYDTIVGMMQLNKGTMGLKHPRTLDSMLILGICYLALELYSEAET